ncbi:dihydroneopterin aldolase [bacterium]|nr:dihydroneopterin aldolase [bacterium]
MNLRVNAIRLEAAHAAYPWEQELGTTIEVDVDVSVLRRPTSDELSQVVAVEDVVNTVHQVSGKKTYHLIESLAYDILDTFCEAHGEKLDDVIVRVRKILPKSDRRISSYEVEVKRK